MLQSSEDVHVYNKGRRKVNKSFDFSHMSPNHEKGNKKKGAPFPNDCEIFSSVGGKVWRAIIE